MLFVDRSLITCSMNLLCMISFDLQIGKCSSTGFNVNLFVRPRFILFANYTFCILQSAAPRRASAATDEEDDEDEDDEDEDNEGEEGDEEFDEDDGSSVESRFLQIVQKMQLSHLETAALRLAIARDDASVRQAIDAFRGSLNEGALMVALRKIAMQTISTTMAEQERQDRAQEGDDDDEDEEEDVSFLWVTFVSTFYTCLYIFNIQQRD